MKKAVGILVALALAAQVAAQQVPPPTSPAKLTQPATGVNMPPAYVKTVARMAYVWGWPMVKPNETQYFYTDDDSPGAAPLMSRGGNENIARSYVKQLRTALISRT